MITTPTLFILGAGASVDYGFPTGEALGAVLEGYRTLYPQWLPTWHWIRDSAQIVPAATEHFPEVQAVRAFQKRFRDCGLRPVDRFAERLDYLGDVESKELLKMWQRLVAHEILWCEQRCLDWRTRPVFRETQQASYLDSNISEDRRPWFSSLFSRMEAGVHRPDNFFARNAVWFWTFNYDRLLEHLFYSALTASFALPDSEGLDTIRALRLVHVHGRTGEYGVPKDQNEASDQNGSVVRFGSTAANDIETAAKGIVYAHGAFENTVMNSVMHTLFRTTTQPKPVRIVYLGFGFDVRNLEKLELTQAIMQWKGWRPTEVYAVLKGGITPRLKPILDEIGIDPNRIYTDIRTLLDAMPD